ncbi:MAG: hypothetical protein ACYDD1_13595 [Caulobacteraceae bacterium]
MPTKPPAVDTAAIPGWGVDADPNNDPTWPMRDRSRDDSPGMNWTPPARQPQSVEVLQSIEYNRRPAVFGEAAPPSGLSGWVRRAAFTFSESRWTHWLMLMAADRINVVEGVLCDIARGKPPNLYAELGFGAAWKYDRPAAVRRLTLLAVGSSLALSLGLALASSRTGSKRRRH